ncbi:hypothetical protein [Nubsella zeaxanthinifaciens]|jgi:hypothetical protein|uniref:hypothetical protein n=1 Tax=Nubsella zeaxanthinifaciens TaxID=392412 RepID=UPI000DE49743|nr:hypothetical protein [Nubsella zeaxanthinifaciens]
MKKINLLALMMALSIILSCKKNSSSSGDGGNPTKPDETAYKPNTIIYGSNKYVRFEVGDANSPIILASPHDGTITPSTMPFRDNPDAVTVRDLYVTDLVEEIASAFYAKTGIHPHVIVNDVARERMEPNRSLEEAYHKSEAANALWREYHGFLKSARDMVAKNVGKGLFLDMHGHGHTKKRVEVGYIVSRSNLNASDATLNGVANTSSIYQLSTTSAYSFSQLIRGDYAFGTLLANEGIPAVPSKTDPTPNDDDYFNGGYCTLTYGSRNGGTVSAIQLETHGTDLRNNATQRKASGIKIADAIIKYMKNHYGLLLDK